MVFVPYVDFPTFVFVVMLMLMLDLIGYQTKIGAWYLAATMLGVFTDGAIFANGGFIQQTVYNANTAAYVNNKVDPNMFAIVMAIMTILSAYFVYWERNLG